LRWSRIGALATVGAAALALWTWGAQVADILTFSSRYVPTAPSTALLMGLLGLSIHAAGRRPDSSAATRSVRGAAAFVLLAGLLVCARHMLGWDSPLERWLAQTAERVDGIPLGMMSPLTAAVLIATAASILLGYPAHGISPARRRTAAGLAIAVLLAGLLVSGSYAMDRPLLYGGSTIPMALWTAVAVTTLGLATLALQCPPRAPGGAGRGGSVASLVTVLLALVVGLLGAAYLRREQALRRSEARSLLSAVADLKVDQIDTWRRERLGDARFFARASFFARDVQSFMAAPTSAKARGDMIHWLTLLKAGSRFKSVVLFDPQGTPVLDVRDPGTPPSPIDRATIEASVRTNRVIVIDLHRDPGTQTPRMDFVFPVFAPGETPLAPDPSPGAFPAAAGRELLGVVRLKLDPGQFLYPMIGSWPTPSRSAETVLGRFEDGEVVTLNGVRHRTDGPFARFSIIAGSRLPAAGAAQGEWGFAEGVDYRGTPVLASVRPVPDSPWFVVAKIDRHEIYAPLRQHAWLTLTVTLVLALAAGLLVGLVWRTRESAFALRELAAERQQRTLAERIDHLMRGANDIILLADGNERILEANDRAVDAYGYPRGELLALRIPDLLTPSAVADFDSRNADLLAQGHARFETENRREDGSPFPVEVSVSLVEIDGVRYRLGIVRDITERKAHEREIDRLTRLYATLSDINQGLVRATSREGIFEDTCRVVAKHTGFRAVWIGCVDKATRTLVPSNFAGDAAEYVRHVRVRLDEEPDNRGPALLSLLEGRPCVVNDFLRDPRMKRKHALATEHGIRAAAAFPLRFRGEVCGVLIVYSGECNVFQEREVALLEEIALDVSFGLDSLDREEQRRAAEEALRRQADELRLRNEELERFNRASVGRELRMVELKRRINELCRETGRPEPYTLDFGDDHGSRQDPAG
jgi:PAS domain S-box-containing protein